MKGRRNCTTSTRPHGKTCGSWDAFFNAYCPSPVCASHGIQFGKTTARVGCISIHDVVMNKRQVDMTKNLSIAEMLKEAGKDY